MPWPCSAQCKHGMGCAAVVQETQPELLFPETFLLSVKHLEETGTNKSWEEARNPALGKAVTTRSFFWSVSDQQIARSYQDCPHSSATQGLVVR